MGGRPQGGRQATVVVGWGPVVAGVPVKARRGQRVRVCGTPHLAAGAHLDDGGQDGVALAPRAHGRQPASCSAAAAAAAAAAAGQAAAQAAAAAWRRRHRVAGGRPLLLVDLLRGNLRLCECLHDARMLLGACQRQGVQGEEIGGWVVQAGSETPGAIRTPTKIAGDAAMGAETKKWGHQGMDDGD